jgi:tRNA/tmRNA/rRNA uracil-C5-methylase (TrmA/RlmC/RlmD family)
MKTKSTRHNLLKKGDLLETTIEAIAFGGDGVGRVDGLVVFVPYTAEGDRVRIRITSVKKNYLRGEIVDIIASSSFRIAPKCRYFMNCGGCQYQHITYNRQLQMKKNQVADAYQRIGFLKSIPIEDCIASPTAYNYRGKAQFHGTYENGRPVLGFMKPGSNQTMDIERCEILDESINRSYADFREHCRKDFSRLIGKDLVFWSGYDYSEPTDLDEALSLIFRQVKNRTFQVPYYGFFQANMILIHKLVDAVIACSDLKGDDTVLDCFCGSGLFSLFAAGHCRWVYGVEIDSNAVACATRNAEAFGYANTTFFTAGAEEIIQKLREEDTKPDLVILDPPRTGCDPEVISAIIELAPDRITYISCDPVTQARDISRIVENGYRLNQVQPIDMFPQTKHIEVIASLSRTG